MNRDHAPILVDNVNGLYSRGEYADSVPNDHLSIANNLVYTDKGFKTRPGTSLNLAVGTVRRMFPYKRLDEVSRLLVLDGSGNLFDSTDIGTPILSIAGMVDFSCAQYFNRIYITPHDRNKGIENEKVYVYDGTTCRPAGGAAPSGSITVSNSALSGNIDAGTHVIAVAYETETGYITKPGPAVYGVLVAPGDKQVDISGIPIGPSGTVARRLLSTRRIGTYDGNQEGYEFYFIPSGRIANNVSTTATVNFYDSQLLTSADYLFDQLIEIPAGVGIGTYQESLVVWGEFDNPSVVRISKQGDPEGFDGVEGFITVAPNESGPVKKAVEYRDSLYIFKGQRTYSTARDSTNPDSAVFWRIVSVDEGIGTECFGVAHILDTAGPNTDYFMVAGRPGVYLFNGMYGQPALTYKVEKVWKAIDSTAFDEVQLFNDVVNNRLYCLLPNSTILVGDYGNGLSFTNIRWSLWTFPWALTAICLDLAPSGKVQLLIAGDGDIWELDTTVFNDDDTAINTKARFAPQGIVKHGAVNQFSSVRFRVKGSGNLEARLFSLDEQITKNLNDIVLSSTPGKETTRLCNLVNEKCAVELELDAAGEWLDFFDMKLFASPVWAERPNVT